MMALAKTKFTEEITTQIVTFYENGLPIKYASELAGVHRSTVYKWLKKGEAAKSGKYRKFYLDILRAKSKFVAYHVNKLNESDADWTSKYLLEVTDPETFVVEKKVQTTTDAEVKVENKVEMTVKPLSERLEDYENYFTQIEAQAESPDSTDSM
jgi:transposase